VRNQLWPALHDASRLDLRDASHPGALALVTTTPGPFLGDVIAPCPAQTSPPNPIAADSGDGRVLSSPSSRAHEPCSFTGAVALRSQAGLTGSGSHRSSYGGFGGGHPHFHPHTRRPKPNLVSHPARPVLILPQFSGFLVPAQWARSRLRRSPPRSSEFGSLTWQSATITSTNLRDRSGHIPDQDC
jgi:hypothetical protein